MRVISVILVVFLLFFSGVRDNMKPVTILNKNILIIFWGESNSGGLAENNDATAGELAPRPRVKLWDNVNMNKYYALDIGTNNLLGHTGLEYAADTCHGWELEIANRVYAGYFGVDTIYICKGGLGGSRMSDWVANLTGHWTTFDARIDSAVKYIGTAKPLKIYVVGSLGWNDGQSHTDSIAFYDGYFTIITRMRAVLGSDVPIYLTNIPHDNSYFSYIDRQIIAIDHAMPYVYSIPTSDAGKESALHWNYAGMKLIADRMCDYIIGNFR
jgi:hypothetical protein